MGMKRISATVAIVTFIVLIFSITGIDAIVADLDIREGVLNKGLIKEKINPASFVLENGESIMATGEVDESPRFDGYIIQFQEAPLLEVRADILREIEMMAGKEEERGAFLNFIFGIFVDDSGDLKRNMQAVLSAQQGKIEGEHEELLSDFSELIPKRQFSKAFNGISVQLDENQLEQIKSKHYVKRVYLNLEVEASLMNSVPLINADDVWKLDEDGELCVEIKTETDPRPITANAISGIGVPVDENKKLREQFESEAKECLTGEGMTIAILDTGVDYTHPDLGGCFIPSGFEGCFEEDRVEFVDAEEDYWCVDTDGESACVIGTAKRHTPSVYPDSSHDYVDECIDQYTVKDYTCLDAREVGNVLINCPGDSYCLGRSCTFPKDLNDGSCDKIIGGYDFANTVDMNGDGDLEDCYNIDSEGDFCEEDFGIDKNGFNSDYDCYALDINGPYCEEDLDPMDDHGHGTHCAGIAAGKGIDKDGDGEYCEFGEGEMCGVAPDAKVYAYKVLDSSGRGYWDWIIAGIERAADPNQDGDFSDHVDVVSMSLGGLVLVPNDPVVESVDNAVDNGVIVVVAAGNDYDYKLIGNPGIAEKAITVGAVDNKDLIPDFSSKGPAKTYEFLTKPDIVAPGVEICSSQLGSAWHWKECADDKHTSISGTSMATPHVAGGAALIKQAHPELNPQEIKSILMGSSRSDVNKNVYKGHTNDVNFAAQYFETTEICTKVTLPIYVDNTYVSFWWSWQDGVDKLILRADANGPGVIVKEQSWNQIGVHGQEHGANLEDIPAGDYWLCSNFSATVEAECGLMGYWHSDYEDKVWNGSEFVDISTVVDRPEDCNRLDIPFYLKYEIEASALSKGAGRLDLSNAVDSWITATPSISFGIVNSQEQVEISLRNILDNEITVDIVSSSTRYVSGINIKGDIFIGNDVLDHVEEHDGWIQLDSSTATIPAGGEVQIGVSLNVLTGAEYGYYTGTIEVNSGIKKHIIPYSFIYKEEEILSAPRASAPVIDGIMNLEEWADANEYLNLGTDGNFKVYLKIAANDSGADYLFVGIKSEGGLNRADLYFDQGFIGDLEGGSYDNILFMLNEDWKQAISDYGPVTDGFWHIIFALGWQGGGADLDFDSMISSDEKQIEFAIPFVGVHREAGSGWSFKDVSDLNVVEGDIVGFGLRTTMDYELYQIPENLNKYDALTFVKILFGSQENVTECSDSDNGKYVHVAGQTSNGVEFQSDYCVYDNQRVFEFYCEEGAVKKRPYDCANGCSNGACIGTTPTSCFDPDDTAAEFIQSLYTQTTVTTDTNENLTDTCLDDNSPTVREYLCDELNQIAWTNYICPMGCIEGACMGNETNQTGDTTPPILNILSAEVIGDVAYVDVNASDPESLVDYVEIYGPVEYVETIRGSC